MVEPCNFLIWRFPSNEGGILLPGVLYSAWKREKVMRIKLLKIALPWFALVLALPLIMTVFFTAKPVEAG